jgi:flagellar protein FliS
MQEYGGGKAADQYLAQRVQGASPEQLVAMLLEAGQRFLNQAMNAMKNHDIPGKAKHLHRVSDIIVELTARLNHEEGGELVTNLNRIYDWWLNELFEAAQENNTDRLLPIQRQMGEFRITWEELHRKKSTAVQSSQPTGSSVSLDGLVV